MGYRASATPKSKGQSRGLHAPQAADAFGPWGGFLPNAPFAPVGVAVDPNLLNLTAASNLLGLVPRGEDLVPDYGWQRHQSAQMPLGGYINGGGTAPSGTGHPLVHIVYVPAVVSPNATDETLVVATKSGATYGTIWQYPGFSDPDTWYSMASLAGGADGGTDKIATSSAEVWDSAVYLPGHTVLLCDSAGFDYDGQTVGLLRYYDGQEWGAFPTPTGVTTMAAQSVCAHQDRILIAGTHEDTTAHPTRIRWTTVGWSTALASPITLPSANLWNDAGAGAIDIEEEVGAACRIRGIGDHIAVYFKRGVVILERSGLYTRPYARRVVTTQRGLVGTQAACDLGSNIHFGIFTDGWFLMNEAGTFKEVGTAEVGGVTIRKWAQAFYDRLSGDYAYTTLCWYDPSRHFVYVAFPDGDDATRPNTVWVYDVYGDRVFPDSYAGVGVGEDASPLAWGETIRFTAAAGLSWDATAGSWDDQGGLWGSSGILSKTLLSHTTNEGIVYQHVPSLVTRNGRYPRFEYLSVPQALGDPSQYKVLIRLLLHHVKTMPIPGLVDPTITITLRDGSSGAVLSQQNVTLRTDATRLLDVRPVWMRARAVQVQVGLSGIHPFVLRGFELEWLPNLGDVRR